MRTFFLLLVMILSLAMWGCKSPAKVNGTLNVAVSNFLPYVDQPHFEELLDVLNVQLENAGIHVALGAAPQGRSAEEVDMVLVEQATDRVTGPLQIVCPPGDPNSQEWRDNVRDQILQALGR